MKKFKGKVLVVGSHACGKSALIQMYVSNGQNFLNSYNMTQGAEISSKVIPFEEQERDVELFFFDLAGQEVYDSITSSLMVADLVAYVYDSTNLESLKSLPKWRDKILKANSNKNLPGVLISTKNDLKTAKSVDTVEGKNLAQQFGVEFFEVSAARNMDIEYPFQALAKKLI